MGSDRDAAHLAAQTQGPAAPASPGTGEARGIAEAAPGPADPLRSATAEHLLPAARAAAAEAGVTRLAELTRLDRLGLPVWQAVRPKSRALSVHQGKGATDADAQIGALLEAVESHLAERFDSEGPVCRFDALPSNARAPALADFARDRDDPPVSSEAHRWIAAEDIDSAESLYLPFDLVSLDLTRGVPSRFDRTSTGLAAGATREEATAVALNEIIERDAVAEWSARGMLACTADGLRLDTAPFGWLREWRERLDHAGSPARFYRASSVTGAPVFVCELNDHNKEAHAYRAVHGTGCHPIPEIALFRALAEAIQGRATLIAGAREDMPPSAYARRAAGAVVAFGLPLAAGMRGVRWDDVEPGPTDTASIVEALARSGYPRIALVELGAPHGFHVVRAFVCGLGAHDRRRRAPIA